MKVPIQAIAYHEAGHAVTAWRIGLKFRYVTIKPDDDSLGHLKHRKVPRSFNPEISNSDRTFMYWQRRIVAGFAGQIAEGEFLGKHPRHGFESDDQNAINAAEYLTGSKKQWQKYLDYCWAVAEDTVEASWKDIKSVAAALLERETLSYEEVRKVIQNGVACLSDNLLRAVSINKA